MSNFFLSCRLFFFPFPGRNGLPQIANPGNVNLSFPSVTPFSRDASQLCQIVQFICSVGSSTSLDETVRRAAVELRTESSLLSSPVRADTGPDLKFAGDKLAPLTSGDVTSED